MVEEEGLDEEEEVDLDEEGEGLVDEAGAEGALTDSRTSDLLSML